MTDRPSASHRSTTGQTTRPGSPCNRPSPAASVALRLPTGPGPVDMHAHAFGVLANAADAGDVWDADQLGTVLGWGGRLAAPDLLSAAVVGGLIGATALAAHIGQVWSGADYPDATLGHARWRELFEVAGFTRDGCPADRPTEPVELWRGSVPQRREDWSWSTDRDMAGRYASGYFGRPPGRLYHLVAPPGALLSAYNGRQESEYVVDTAHPDVVISEVDQGD